MFCWLLTFAGTSSPVRSEVSSGSRRYSENKVFLSGNHDQNMSKKGYLSGYYDNSLCLSPRGIGGGHHADYFLLHKILMLWLVQNFST